jgi:SAM domain (Sterile alpha motif)
MDLGGWLRSLGLECYEAAFRENEIDETVLLTIARQQQAKSRELRAARTD